MKTRQEHEAELNWAMESYADAIRSERLALVRSDRGSGLGIPVALLGIYENNLQCGGGR